METAAEVVEKLKPMWKKTKTRTTKNDSSVETDQHKMSSQALSDIRH